MKIQSYIFEALSDTSDIVYIKKPSYPGGEEARLKWLRENLEYPQQAVADEIQGLVQVGFVVEKDGSITNVKVVQSAHSTLDREAVRFGESYAEMDTRKAKR